jgi:hypothetical protein
LENFVYRDVNPTRQAVAAANATAQPKPEIHGNPSIYSVSQGIESPDLSSVMEEYDRLMEETKREKDGWRKVSGIGVLTDIGLLIGDAVGARGNANVNKRDAVTGKFNEQTEKLRDLYRNMAARRPELAAQMLQRKFQNDLAAGNYNLSAENQKYQREYKAAQMASENAYREAKLKGQSEELARKAAIDAFNIWHKKAGLEETRRHNEQTEKTSGINANNNKRRTDAYVQNGGSSRYRKGNINIDTGDEWISIRPDVWDGGAKSVGDAIIDDAKKNAGKYNIPRDVLAGRKKMSGKELEDFVKQNSRKLPPEIHDMLIRMSAYDNTNSGKQNYPDGLDEFEKYVE